MSIEDLISSPAVAIVSASSTNHQTSLDITYTYKVKLQLHYICHVYFAYIPTDYLLFSWRSLLPYGYGYHYIHCVCLLSSTAYSIIVTGIKRIIIIIIIIMAKKTYKNRYTVCYMSISKIDIDSLLSFN